MDIAALSMNMHQNSIQNQVSLSVLKLTMDSNTELANQTTDMLDSIAGDTNLGINLDVTV